jgi:hypothetical protein
MRLHNVKTKQDCSIEENKLTALSINDALFNLGYVHMRKNIDLRHCHDNI